nr:hypothetical protein GCM10020093_031780 [Planobispora longispora]
MVPKLWNETIEAHRHAVREATLDTTAALVARHGLRAVTMSRIAEETGIGRATLYKYFPDVEAILIAWHERQIAGHLDRLAELRDRAGSAGERLEAVLEAYAFIQHRHHGTDAAALLHQGEHVIRARRHLGDFLRDLLAEGRGPVSCVTTSRPTSSRSTACMPWPRPWTCRPRTRSAGSSRSSSRGSVLRVDGPAGPPLPPESAGRRGPPPDPQS